MEEQKQEVTLDRLYRPQKPLKFAGRDLVVRALSGSETDERQMYATNKARRLEKKLSDHESDDYLFRVSPIENMTLADVRQFLVTRRTVELRSEIEKENQPVYLPFPDEATDEEKRAILNQRDEQESERKAKIANLTQARLSEWEQATLDGKPDEDLRKLGRIQITNFALNDISNKAYAWYTLFVAVNNPDGSHYFASPDEVSAVPDPVVFSIFREAQSVGDINPLTLNGAS